MTHVHTHRIIGPPGTGKTTWLSNKVAEILADNTSSFGHMVHDNPVMVCSLTRTAAAEVVSKAESMDLELPAHAVGTLHSHAYRALEHPTVVAGEQIAEWNKEHPAYRIGGQTTDPDDPLADRVRSDRGDELLAEYDLVRQRMTPKCDWSRELRKFADTYQVWKEVNGLLDFTDMIAPCKQERVVPEDLAPHIMVDEAQDCSRLELELLRQWAASADNLYLVGDPWQSLYTWRGAYPAMFTRDTGNTTDTVLSQSYRVPSECHRMACAWVEQLTDHSPIEYAPTSTEGSVRTATVHYRQGKRLVDLAQGYLDQGMSVMVQASCSHFVRPFVRACRDMGVPFSNRWRRKRGDWNPLAPRKGKTASDRLRAWLKPAQTGDLWTAGEIDAWLSVVKTEGLTVRGAKAGIMRFAAEKPEEEVTFDELMKWFDGDALAEMWKAGVDGDDATAARWFDEHVLASKAPAYEFPLSVLRHQGHNALNDGECMLSVGTVHSFKGAEADVVIILPDLSMAGYREWMDLDHRDSVVRLMYVALTRARHHVVVCQPFVGEACPDPTLPVGAEQ